MYNNTRDDYKKAIKAKYEIEKEGEFSNYFLPTSQANLRNLCWERFKLNENRDDLITFNDFFGFHFDLTKKNHFSTSTTDKFRSIVSFLKGKKEPANFYSVEIAAILVDFQPRPYKKFKEKGVIIFDKPIKNPNIPETFLVKPEKNKVENELKLEDSQPKNFFINFKSKFYERLFKRSKATIIATTIIFCLIGLVIYLAFIKKDCMQWSDDHFEVVDCTSDAGHNMNGIIPLDKNLLDFRKVIVYDTTACFKKNGSPFFWYSKKNNKVDFYNMSGKSPENSQPLRAATQYMVTKYGKKH